MRKLRVARVEGADRPRQRSEYQHPRADWTHITVTADVGRPDENDDADKPEYESDQHRTVRTLPRWPHPLDDHQPERENRYQQRGESGRDELLGPDNGPITAEKKKAASDDRVSPVNPRRTLGAAIPGPRIKEGTRYDKAKPTHDERRDRLHCISDREICRSPDQVYRSERSNYLRARSVLAFVQRREIKSG